MSQHAALYKSKQWHRLRWHQLQKQPLCHLCQQLGRTTAATVVDHIKPHRGDLALFYDEANLASMCKPCHDRHKQSQERTGHLRGNDVDGYPLDPSHHWSA